MGWNRSQPTNTAVDQKVSRICSTSHVIWEALLDEFRYSRCSAGSELELSVRPHSPHKEDWQKRTLGKREVVFLPSHGSHSSSSKAQQRFPPTVEKGGRRAPRKFLQRSGERGRESGACAALAGVLFSGLPCPTLPLRSPRPRLRSRGPSTSHRHSKQQSALVHRPTPQPPS